MPPDHRQQVHQALFDPLELLREARHGLAELLEALALEARIIRHDFASPRARLDQSLRQGGARIARSLGDPLMMHQAPPRPPSSTWALNCTGTCCHGRHPGQRGIARLTVSKSRNASGDANWASVFVSVGSTTMRPLCTAFTWRA